MNPIAVVHLLTAVVLVVTAVPLVVGLVPMNRWYGVRIRAAFASDAAWYEINRYGGWRLLVWGLTLALTGMVGMLLDEQHWAVYNWTALAVILGGLAVVLVATLRQARGLGKA